MKPPVTYGFKFRCVCLINHYGSRNNIQIQEMLLPEIKSDAKDKHEEQQLFNIYEDIWQSLDLRRNN
ncbi:hypothetical protein GmHk_07G018982 [Glycine max]|nr:hypothetical protein GmHk_07G018982 [Glycine max]